MKLLFLAPQPFFQERGTPIAVRLALEVLAHRFRHGRLDGLTEIDLLTYHEGEEIKIPGLNIHRISPPQFIKNVGPGLSVKKLICDLYFVIAAFRLIFKNGTNSYALVHAVEESVFIAWLFKQLFSIPYIYDMDSSLALQVTEKWFLLKPFYPLLAYFERIAVRGSLAVAPVCDALAVLAKGYGSPLTLTLQDISLLKNLKETKVDLRNELSLPPQCKIVLYVGNLERYQGIDLLLNAFRLIEDANENTFLVIIGGTKEKILKYETLARSLSLNRTIFAGTRPVEALGAYITNSDVLVSPRIKGNNTPMKVYSYLHSGIPIVATALPTHTQVMDGTVAMLCEAKPHSYAEGIHKLLQNQEFAQSLGKRAKELAEKRYTFEVFEGKLNELYDQVVEKLPFAAIVN